MQTKVINRCLEAYLHYLACNEPTNLRKYLDLAEVWYNTSYHSAIEMKTFQALYGWPPHALPQYTFGSSNIASIDNTLIEHQKIIAMLMETIRKTHQRMIDQANKHHLDNEFQVGELVHLHLRVYRQASVARHNHHKLSKRYFRPFKILERIRESCIPFGATTRFPYSLYLSSVTPHILLRE